MPLKVRHNSTGIGDKNDSCRSGWANNATGGPVEGNILVDGAKRDRYVIKFDNGGTPG